MQLRCKLFYLLKYSNQLALYHEIDHKFYDMWKVSKHEKCIQLLHTWIIALPSIEYDNLLQRG